MKLLFVCIAIIASLIPPCTAFPAEGEYQVKAAMLYNFAKFIEWPPATLGSDNKLLLCVAGKSGILEAAQQLHDKQVKGRTLNVRQITRPEEISDCHIVFIPQTEKARLSNYLLLASHLSVLTVSDMEQFAASGGMIGFYDHERKVRFEINPDAAQKGKILISSHLLKLARIVR
jgi:hypothetical protein